MKKLSKLLLCVLSLFYISSCFLLTGCFNENTKTVYLNEPTTSGSITIIATDVENTKQIGSPYLGETTNNNFIIISIVLLNSGNSEVSLWSSSFSLKSGDSTYELSDASLYLDEGFYLILNIGAGITKTTRLVFETPTTSLDSTYTLNFKVGYLDSTAKISLNNRI